MFSLTWGLLFQNCIQYFIKADVSEHSACSILIGAVSLTPPMKMEQTDISETSAHEIQTSGNHSKDRMRQILCMFNVVRIIIICVPRRSKGRRQTGSGTERRPDVTERALRSAALRLPDVSK